MRSCFGRTREASTADPRRRLLLLQATRRGRILASQHQHIEGQILAQMQTHHALVLHVFRIAEPLQRSFIGNVRRKHRLADRSHGLRSERRRVVHEGAAQRQQAPHGGVLPEQVGTGEQQRARFRAETEIEALEGVARRSSTPNRLGVGVLPVVESVPEQQFASVAAALEGEVAVSAHTAGADLRDAVASARLLLEELDEGDARGEMTRRAAQLLEQGFAWKMPRRARIGRFPGPDAALQVAHVRFAGRTRTAAIGFDALKDEEIVCEGCFDDLLAFGLATAHKMGKALEGV